MQPRNFIGQFSFGVKMKNFLSHLLIRHCYYYLLLEQLILGFLST